jgi:pyruvate dehydrogenase E2 component (dihydrolipoamide acetyltransferase)
MPQMGETVTEGTITRWMKAVGDSVARDEPLFEVSTDKVDTEVPSPLSGVLQEILVPEGDTVEVGTRLAVIGEAVGSANGSGAPADTVEATPAETAAPAPPQAAPAPPQAAPAPPPAPPGFTSAPPSAPPPPAAFVALPPDQPEVSTPPQAAPSRPEVDQADQTPLLLSPMVRRLLSDNGIDPASVVGTGLGGRITREDVLGVLDARGVEAPPAEPVAAQPAPEPAASVSVAARSSEIAPVPASNDRVVPFSRVRRRTAEHMVRSKSTSPHAFIAAETDFENVERVRKAWGPRFKAEEGFSLTYLPFVARASVEALREFPNLNASVAEDSLIVHQEINLGIAVDLDFEGLIVPVVHRAEEITLRGIARRIRDLADRARTRQLVADDISGGTFSITNDGPFGTYFTVPIINQPQVAILATDGIKRRPVVITHPDGSESIAIHSVGVLGMSWDHRAVDGAYVSSFLARLGELLQTRDWAAEL